ncbi:MAG: arginyltransferase [Alphaproteobacteria bacterium]
MLLFAQLAIAKISKKYGTQSRQMDKPTKWTTQVDDKAKQQEIGGLNDSAASSYKVEPVKADLVRKGLPRRLNLAGIAQKQEAKSGIRPVNWHGFSHVFAVTPAAPCPYLPDLQERKLVTAVSNAHMSALNHAGFRRSHNLAYRPACAGCNRCKALRVLCADFKPTTSQKRLLKKNTGLERRFGRAVASAEHFALFEDYVVTRHGDGEMAQMTMSDFRAMLEETPVSTMLVEWRDTVHNKGRLVAACLVDITVDGLSMVYSYFHPAYEIKGLGTYMILDLIKFSNEKNLPYVYLGYWVKGSPKMDYKVKFQPQEVYDTHGWVPN